MGGDLIVLHCSGQLSVERHRGPNDSFLDNVFTLGWFPLKQPM